jgi:periplasmic protein TonB
LTAIRKGLLAAGLVHGALLSLWLAHEFSRYVYRESLRLDFQIFDGQGAQSAQGSRRQRTSEAPQSENAESPVAASPAAAPVSAQSSAGDESGYAGTNMAAISGLIHGKIYYPRIARRNNWQGCAVVHFVVDTDGTTTDVALRQSSGHKILDESAVETIRELSGLPKPPVPVPLTVPVYFRLTAAK